MTANGSPPYRQVAPVVDGPGWGASVVTRPKVTRIGSHDIAFRPTGFGGFYSATCKTCDALLTCGFPFGFCFHTASHHAGICDCDGPSLVTWT